MNSKRYLNTRQVMLFYADYVQKRGGGRGKGREFTVLFLVGVICVNSLESLYRFNAKAR